MDRLYFALAIGLLFATTLWQAREIGETKAELRGLEATLKYTERLAKSDQVHQTELDESNQASDIIIKGLQNDIVQQTADFESQGIADPIALGDSESKFLNDWLRRNSRRPRDGATDIQAVDPTTTGDDEGTGANSDPGGS